MDDGTRTEETAFWKSVFRNLPSAAVVVDAGQRVVALSAMAEALLGKIEGDVLFHRPGELFDCANARRHSLGCGFSDSCSHCSLRASIDESLAGTGFYQREVKIGSRQTGEGFVEERYFLVSGAPVEAEGEPKSLVLLQDVTALHRLRGLIPICAGCKKIRREDSAWEALETYIHEHSHADFTHGLCPDCLQKYLKQDSQEP